MSVLPVTRDNGSSEPMFVHPRQEFTCDRKTAGYADNGIDFTLGTKRGLGVINPLRDVGRRKRGKAVETPAKRTTLHFGTVQPAMLVRLDMRRIETVRIQSKHDVIQCTA